MSNIPTGIREDQDSFSYLTRDSNGDWHTINAQKCKICNQFMMGTPHPACVRQVNEQRAAEAEQLRIQQCIEQFGQALSKREHERRMYPSYRVDGMESYNEQLVREQREAEEARRKELRDRELRKKRVKDLEYELKWLHRKIEEDDAAAKAEAEQGQQP